MTKFALCTRTTSLTIQYHISHTVDDCQNESPQNTANAFHDLFTGHNEWGRGQPIRFLSTRDSIMLSTLKKHTQIQRIKLWRSTIISFQKSTSSNFSIRKKTWCLHYGDEEGITAIKTSIRNLCLKSTPRELPEPIHEDLTMQINVQVYTFQTWILRPVYSLRLVLCCMWLSNYI